MKGFNLSKIFVDFEFTRQHQYTTPVSIGIVSEDGKSEFYAEFTDFDKSQVDPWLEENVLNLLTLADKPSAYLEIDDTITLVKGSVPFVVNTVGGLNDWLRNLNHEQISFASFGLTYDAVLFRELFKIAETDFPLCLDGFGFDVSTMLQVQGIDPNIEGVKEEIANMKSEGKHNALYDAHVARNIYLKLQLVDQ